MKKLYQKKKGASRTLTSDAYLKHPKAKTNLESRETQLRLEVKNQCILKLAAGETVSSGLRSTVTSVGCLLLAVQISSPLNRSLVVSVVVVQMLLCHQSRKMSSGQVYDLFGGIAGFSLIFKLGWLRHMTWTSRDPKSRSHVVQNWDFISSWFPGLWSGSRTTPNPRWNTPIDSREILQLILESFLPPHRFHWEWCICCSRRRFLGLEK